MKNQQRKRRTREHVIADLSVNHVERHALLCGFTIQRTAHDYGIDLEITTFDRLGQVQEGQILIQLKATDRVNHRKDGTIAWRISRLDLVYWLANPLPVLLIVFDAKKEVAYWLYVQSYFGKSEFEGFNLFTAGKSITVSIPTLNVVDAKAVKRFAGFRDSVMKQMREVIHDEDENDTIR